MSHAIRKQSSLCVRTKNHLYRHCTSWWYFGNQNGRYLRRIILLKLLLLVMVSLSFWYLLNTSHRAIYQYSELSNYSEQHMFDINENNGEEEDFKLLELSYGDKQKIEEEMKRRRSRVQDMCRNRGMLQTNLTTNIEQHEAILHKLLIDKNHNTAWCPIYKAGSSFVMELFARMGGKMTTWNRNRLKRGEIQVNTLARQAYRPIRNMKTAAKVLNASNRFIVVRHPFERLLSAYRDKLEHRAGREYFYNKYGRSITWFYRNGRYIRNKANNKTSGKENTEPTFFEYLRFIAEKKLFDEHWKPYMTECLPCLLDYQYIVKIESFHQDISYLISKLELKQFLPPKQRNIHKNLKQREQGDDRHSLAHFYYSQIPSRLLQKIYLLYEADFILFNYSPKKYFDMTKNYDKSV